MATCGRRSRPQVPLLVTGLCCCILQMTFSASLREAGTTEKLPHWSPIVASSYNVTARALIASHLSRTRPLSNLPRKYTIEKPTAERPPPAALRQEERRGRERGKISGGA